MKTDSKLLYSFDAAARELNVRPARLKKAARMGQLLTVKLVNRQLIPRSELVRLSGGTIGAIREAE